MFDEYILGIRADVSGQREVVNLAQALEAAEAEMERLQKRIADQQNAYLGLARATEIATAAYQKQVRAKKGKALEDAKKEQLIATAQAQNAVGRSIDAQQKMFDRHYARVEGMRRKLATSIETIAQREARRQQVEVDKAAAARVAAERRVESEHRRIANNMYSAFKRNVAQEIAEARRSANERIKEERRFAREAEAIDRRRTQMARQSISDLLPLRVARDRLEQQSIGLGYARRMNLITEAEYQKGIKRAEALFESTRDVPMNRRGGLEGVIGSTAALAAKLSFAYVVAERFFRMMQRGGEIIMSFVKASIDAIETENLFNVAFGKGADAAKQWVEQYAEVFRLNRYRLMDEFGRWKLVLDSFGFDDKRAAELAQAITKRTVDIASLRNIPISEVTEKVHSGLSGQVRPLAEIGIDMHDTTVQAWALAHGLAEAGKEMGFIEKVTARVGVLMSSTSKDAGDWARTFYQPANQLKTISEQLDLSHVLFGKLITDSDMFRGVIAEISESLTNMNKVMSFGSVRSDLREALADTINIAGILAPFTAAREPGVGNFLKMVASTALGPFYGLGSLAIKKGRHKAGWYTQSELTIPDTRSYDIGSLGKGELTEVDTESLIPIKETRDAGKALLALHERITMLKAAMEEFDRGGERHRQMMLQLADAYEEYAAVEQNLARMGDKSAETRAVNYRGKAAGIRANLRAEDRKQELEALKEAQKLLKEDMDAEAKFWEDQAERGGGDPFYFSVAAEELRRMAPAYLDLVRQAEGWAESERERQKIQSKTTELEQKSLDIRKQAIKPVLEEINAKTLAYAKWHYQWKNFGLDGSGFGGTIKGTSGIEEIDSTRYWDDNEQRAETFFQRLGEMWRGLGAEVEKSFTNIFENGFAAIFRKGSKATDIFQSGFQNLAAAASSAMSSFIVGSIFGTPAKDGKPGTPGLFGSTGFGDMWSQMGGMKGGGFMQAGLIGGGLLFAYGQARQNRGAAALGGAMAGAGTGAYIGAQVGTGGGAVGIIVGAVVGALLGGLAGYFSVQDKRQDYNLRYRGNRALVDVDAIDQVGENALQRAFTNRFNELTLGYRGLLRATGSSLLFAPSDMSGEMHGKTDDWNAFWKEFLYGMQGTRDMRSLPQQFFAQARPMLETALGEQLGVSSGTIKELLDEFADADNFEQAVAKLTQFITVLKSMQELREDLGQPITDMIAEVTEGPFAAWKRSTQDAMKNLDDLRASLEGAIGDEVVKTAEQGLEAIRAQFEANKQILAQIVQEREAGLESIGNLGKALPQQRARKAGLYQWRDYVVGEFGTALRGLGDAQDIDDLSKARGEFETWANELIGVIAGFEELIATLDEAKESALELDKAIGVSVQDRLKTLSETSAQTFERSMQEQLDSITKLNTGLHQTKPEEFVKRIQEIIAAGQDANAALDQFVQSIYNVRQSVKAGFDDLFWSWDVAEAKKWGGSVGEGQLYVDELMRLEQQLMKATSPEEIESISAKMRSIAGSLYALDPDIQVDYQGEVMDVMEWLRPFMEKQRGLADTQLDKFEGQAEAWRKKLDDAMGGLADDIQEKRNLYKARMDDLVLLLESSLQAAADVITSKTNAWQAAIEAQNSQLRTAADAFIWALQYATNSLIPGVDSDTEVSDDGTITRKRVRRPGTGGGGTPPPPPDVQIPLSEAADIASLSVSSFSSKIDEATAALSTLSALAATLGGSVIVTINTPDDDLVTVQGNPAIVKVRTT